MAEGGSFTFSDPDGYAAAFGDTRINITITDAGDFKARMTRLKLKHLEVYCCYENLPRIAYISLSPGPIFMSFPVGTVSHFFDGFALQRGDVVLHSRGERMHQRLSAECQWGLVSLSPAVLASCGEALTGRPIASPSASRIFHPTRANALRFRRLLSQACRLAEAGKKLIGHPEVARALEQEMLHAIIHCLASNEANNHPKTRHRHAAVMARFEEMLSKRTDERLTMPALCAEIGVPERTLRMCCAELLGESPTRYVLLQRLNKARAALRRADPSTASVAEVARNYQFVEFGRFSVMYRATFGESPSVTLQRNPRS
jgi:AraC-like DNA-binding protein